MLTDFIQIYRLYRQHNGVRHAWRSAWNIAVRKLPF